MTAAVDSLSTVYVGPLAVARGCKLCKFVLSRKRLGGQGRGAGFREGNKQRGKMLEHIKTAHPQEYSIAKKQGDA